MPRYGDKKPRTKIRKALRRTHNSKSLTQKVFEVKTKKLQFSKRRAIT